MKNSTKQKPEYKMTYKIVKDFKGFVDKYMRVDWTIAAKCFSEYLSAIEDFIQYFKNNSSKRLNDEQELNDMVIELCNYFDRLANAVINKHSHTISVAYEGDEGNFIEKICKGDIAMFNKVIVHAVRRKGYRVDVTEEQLNQNQVLRGVRIKLDRGEYLDSMPCKNPELFDYKTIIDTIRLINLDLIYNTYNTEKLIDVRKYLPNSDDVSTM